MARYNLIQIGSVYLTRTGLVGGAPCKTNVSGLDSIKPAWKKNVIKAIDGTPFSQRSESTKGFDVEISIDWLAKTVFDSINVLFDAADDGDSTIAVVIDGDGGTFNLTVTPNSNYVGFDKFSNGILQGVKYRMVTAA